MYIILSLKYQIKRIRRNNYGKSHNFFDYIWFNRSGSWLFDLWNINGEYISPEVFFQNHNNSFRSRASYFIANNLYALEKRKERILTFGAIGAVIGLFFGIALSGKKETTKDE